MADEGRFEFNDDEEMDSGLIFHEDLLHQRIDRLGRWVAALSVLLPCLVGLLLYFGYRDLSARVSLNRDSGLQRVEKLGNEVLERLDALTTRVAELETGASRVAELESRLSGLQATLDEVRDQLTARVTEIERTGAETAASTGSVVARLARAEQQLSRLASEKADKSELQQVNDALAQSLAPLQAEISAVKEVRGEIEALAPLREQVDTLEALSRQVTDLSTRLATVENALGKELSEVAGYIEKINKDLDEIQASIAALSKDKVGGETLQLELLKVRKSTHLDMLREITKLQKSLLEFETRLRRLERSAAGA